MTENVTTEEDPVTILNEDDDEIPVTLYTRQFTIDQFEKSKFETTAKSLRELLENILSDPTMKADDKRRHLNNIRRQYPHIIQARFGVMTEKNWNHLVATYCVPVKNKKKG